MEGKVVHCKKDEYDVYIGRPGEWGNPFVIGKDGTRDEVIAKYRVWLWEEIKAERQMLVPLAELRGKTLGCWCAPEACHGDVLLEAAAWAMDVLRRGGLSKASWNEQWPLSTVKEEV